MLLKPFLYVLLFSCFVLNFPATVLAEPEEHHEVDPKSGAFWGQIVAIFFLVILSGIVAGLTLGLMSLDTTNLAILEIAGTPQQKYYASRIIPIRKNGHILLTTLLLTNTVLNETLPILFDGIFSTGFISVIVSTALLVMFSEIIPQAIFSKHGLAIGALFAYPVRILIGMWFIISWPISKFLDYLLGTHTGFIYGVSEFGALVQLHDSAKYPDGTLNHKTVTVLQNVLSMQEKYADGILTSASNMLMLKPDVMLTPSKVQQYHGSGYSHIIVYEKGITASNQHDDHQILGVLELKSLNLLESKSFNEPIGKMRLDTYLTASSREPVIDLMNQLFSQDSDAQVILIYRTEQDIKVIKEESYAAAREIQSIEAKALKKHKNSLSCRVRRLFRSKCHLCHHLSTPSESDIGEEETISSNRTVEMSMKAGLIGMVTKKEILNQLVCPRLEPKDKSASFPQVVHGSLKASQN
ncbi:uncharacterized protein EV154DRAFT_589276 [Mucor mucedo]|uniref:uncharacterized protein n=1 Tax=Mucor mucedo TaxID=29922 RepID=UPI00221F1E83|nr:uncharacterized protein EV154DRAFT_589276 [Mucor mucedo]KAI7896360.1 hypothetical protein EV154DRAFT_589276 [Mucor mucedo]